jgi:O-antigen/teichoic acid export membrane protein
LSHQTARRAGSAFVWQAAQMVGTKAIFLLRTLALARLLAPADFGLLAIAFVAVETLLVLTNLGLVPALVQHPAPTRAQFDSAWTAGLARALGVTLVVIAAAPVVALLFDEPGAAGLIRLAALRPLIEASGSIKIAEATRQLDFRRLALVRLPDAVVNTVVAIALARAFGPWAMVAGSLAGALVTAVLSYVAAPHRPRLTFDWRASAPLLRFGRWIFLIAIISMLGRAALQATISRQLSVADLGLYSLAARLAFLPYEVGSELLGAVAFPLFAGLQDKGRQLARAYRTILLGMLALMMPTTALLIALAPALTTAVLGDRWAGTTDLIRALALVNVLGLFGETVVPLLKGAGRPYRLAIIEGVQATLLLVGVLVLIPSFGVLGAALAWLPAVGVAQALCAWLALPLLDRPLAGVGRPLAAIVLASLGGALAALLVAMAWPGLAGFVVAVAIGGGGGALALWAAERQWRLGLSADLALAFPRLAAWIRLAPAE